ADLAPHAQGPHPRPALPDRGQRHPRDRLVPLLLGRVRRRDRGPVRRDAGAVAAPAAGVPDLPAPVRDRTSVPHPPAPARVPAHPPAPRPVRAPAARRHRRPRRVAASRAGPGELSRPPKKPPPARGDGLWSGMARVAVACALTLLTWSAAAGETTPTETLQQ